APLGCAGVDEEGELVGEAAEALSAPALVSASLVDFGTLTLGSVSTLNVTLTNTGDARAIGINLDVPPDPYRTVRSPLTELGVDTSSKVMAIAFAPKTAGVFSSTLVVTYRDAADSSGGKLYTLSIPVTGTAK
ncbi:MAG: hypothetical protein ACMG6S_16255, partial [Byssovorax sp.]